jgi:hypothetical protein
MLAVRAPHGLKKSPFLEHLYPPSVGVQALHPRTFGYRVPHFSILAGAIQEDARGINLKISDFLS